MKSKILTLITAAALLLCLLFISCEGGNGCKIINGTDASDSQNSTNSGFLTGKDDNIYNVDFNVVQGQNGGIPSTGDDLKTVLSRIRPSVVEILISSGGAISSAGSGVVIASVEGETQPSQDGVDGQDEITVKPDKSVIMTCHNIIERAKGRDEVIVSTISGDIYYASLIASDPESDICVLSVEALLTPVTFLEDSGLLEVGESVVAIGNPISASGGTVTSGIISATARTVSVDGVKMSVLQTDAVVNNGNSGGGLFTTSGYLVGIVNDKIAQAFSETVKGLGFAIPSNVAKSVAKDLMEYGYIPGKYLLGCSVANRYIDVWGTRSYVYVSSLNEYGCFAKAGIEVEDRLENVTYTYGDKTTDKYTITNADEFISYLNGLNLQVGGVLSFQLRRGGTVIYKNVEILQYIYGQLD